MRIRPIRYRLIFSVLLILSSPAISLRAAISNGAVTTNATQAEQKRIVDFYQAEQSFQEKLRVGKVRYDQKQAARAKAIAAMSSELHSRQQTVFDPTEGKTDPNAEDALSWFNPLALLEMMGVILLGLVFYQQRRRRPEVSGRKRQTSLYSMPRPAPSSGH